MVVVEENRSYADILHGHSAPYFAHLARTGVSFTHSYALTHPSEPNYLALFSGSTLHVTDDSCPHAFRANNLGHQVRAAGYTFVGYSESLPHAGDRMCAVGAYARRHSPWTNFTDLPARLNRPMRAFPTNPARLPSLSFVIPNLNHDMHDGTIRQADTWLRSHLGRYARWARTHHSLLVVTFDEDDRSEHNRIPTIAVGAGVRPGPSRQHITHYNLLRTLEHAYHVRPLGHAAHVRGIVRLGR